MLFLCTTFIEMVVHMMINHICYAPLEPLMRTVSKCTESFERTDANRDRCRPRCTRPVSRLSYFIARPCDCREPT
jgi:hypothetical protein